MTAPGIDRGVVGIALLGVTVSVAWWIEDGGRIARDARAALERPEHKPWAAAEAGTAGAMRWAEPAAQSRGPGWIYDLFTPPEIYYDGSSRQYTVGRPSSVTALAPAEKVDVVSFGLEVRAVQRPLFRLQLIGFVGGEGSYRGVFEKIETGETFLAAGARPVPGLRARIETFEVIRLAVDLAESMTTFRPVARARVYDEASGETVMLTNLERCYATAPTALVATREAADELREVHEGDTVEAGRATFTIERIQLMPPRLDVTKAAKDGKAPERRTLAVAGRLAEPNL